MDHLHQVHKYTRRDSSRIKTKNSKNVYINQYWNKRKTLKAMENLEIRVEIAAIVAIVTHQSKKQTLQREKLEKLQWNLLFKNSKVCENQ